MVDFCWFFRFRPTKMESPMQVVDVSAPKDKPHYDLDTLVEQTARTLARAGLAHDRLRLPPNKEWQPSEWEERVLQCIPKAEEKHARNVAKVLVNDIKRVLLPPPPFVMALKRPPTYEELEKRVADLEAAIKPIVEDMDRTGLHSSVNDGADDSADLFNLDPSRHARSELKVGHLRRLYQLLVDRT